MLSSFFVDINMMMLTEDFKLGLVCPEYLLPVISSSVFVLPGKFEVFF